MSDQELGTALAQTRDFEKKARQHWQAASTFDERDRALQVVRHVGATIRMLENWIASRAEMRAQAS